MVYPEKSPGEYIVSSQNIKPKNISKNLDIFIVKNQNLKFEREDGNLPSRLITALKLDQKINQLLPCGISLGIIHKKRPQKDFTGAC